MSKVGKKGLVKRGGETINWNLYRLVVQKIVLLKHGVIEIPWWRGRGSKLSGEKVVVERKLGRHAPEKRQLDERGHQLEEEKVRDNKKPRNFGKNLGNAKPRWSG